MATPKKTPLSRIRPSKRPTIAPPEKSPYSVTKSPTATSLKPAPIHLTHPDKILDTETQLTKQQLADYYWAIAPYMLPHISGRPISLVRCPEGSTETCFYQKHLTDTLPPGIEPIDIPNQRTGKPEPYITLSTPEALASLAQISVLEVHPWGSRNQDLEHPDRLIFDLDPDPSIPWPVLAASATEIRKRLQQLGLESFLKLTGGKGLHIVLPIQPEHDWATIKDFTHAFALEIEHSNPQLYLTKMSKAARKDRIFLDYLRNERGATAVAPYSPRARTGATIAMPLPWSDLKPNHKLAERPTFHAASFSDWKSRLHHDPWKQLPSLRQHLTPELLAQFKTSK